MSCVRVAVQEKLTLLGNKFAPKKQTNQGKGGGSGSKKKEKSLEEKLEKRKRKRKRERRRRSSLIQLQSKQMEDLEAVAAGSAAVGRKQSLVGKTISESIAIPRVFSQNYDADGRPVNNNMDDQN